VIRRFVWAVVTSPVSWAVVAVFFSVRWGRGLQHTAPEVFLGAAPFVGRNFRDGWDWRWNWALVGAAVVGAVVVGSVWRGWWWRLRLRWVLVASAVGSGFFATLLALTDRTDGLLYGVSHKSEYLANLKIAPPAGEFVRGFVDHIGRYTVHARGHPPGFILVLKALDSIGLSGPWPVVAMIIAATMVLPAGVLVAVNAVAGADWMRRCAPLLLTAPYVLWMVSSADAVYAAIAAWSLAVFVLATRSLSARRSLLLGVCAGVLFGALLFLTYGGAMFAIAFVVLAVAALRSRLPGVTRALVGGVVGAGAVTAGFAAAGFWWFAGAAATRHEYWAGSAQFRSFGYFAVANLAVTAVIIGPAALTGARRLITKRSDDRRVGMLVLAGGAALLASHASQYSRGEVERIWLLFYPWVILAAGVWMSRDKRLTATLAVGSQVVIAVVLQAALVSKW
jgi:methylthioxylose transferase